MPETRRAGSAARASRRCCCARSPAGCAEKGPPTGGPPDLEPPRGACRPSPDSGAAGVATRTARLGRRSARRMEPRTTGDALEFAPPLVDRAAALVRRTVALVLEDSLRAEPRPTRCSWARVRATCTATRCVDRARGACSPPRTTFPPGVIVGRRGRRGLRAPGTSLWCYRDGRKPDSTARDFERGRHSPARPATFGSPASRPARWPRLGASPT